MENAPIIQAQVPANDTVAADAPITGGKQAIVIQQLQVRQSIRAITDASQYVGYIRAAESRYVPNRTYLYDAYAHALLDGHLFGVMQKRINTVLNKPLFYMNEEGEAVEEMTTLIKSYEFREVIKAILESVFWGISGLEFIPGKQLELRQIPRKHIKPKRQIIAVEQNNQDSGIDYTKLSNVWVIGEAEDLGILLPATLYAIYKRNALGDWANFVEIFGQPMRIVKFDPNDQTTQEVLKQTLDEAGSALSLMIPNTAEFEIMDGKTSNATGELQHSFIDAMDQAISIIVLGNTETTTNGKTGSQAKSKVHSEQQNEILKSDMALVAAYLNDPHFIRILQSYGLPVTEGGCFEFNKDIDIDFLFKRVDIDVKLAQMGLPIGTKYLYETYNIPVPEPSEELVIAKGPQPTNPHPEPDTDNKPEPAEPSEGPDLSDILDQKLRAFFG